MTMAVTCFNSAVVNVVNFKKVTETKCDVIYTVQLEERSESIQGFKRTTIFMSMDFHGYKEKLFVGLLSVESNVIKACVLLEMA